jgi:hypothetical protein
MFRGLAQIFVNAFGITPPTPETEERTGMMIAAACLAIVAMLGLVAFTLFKILG